MSLLVKDGILNVEELEKTKVTRQQLYAMLREKQILNLAKVERAYPEADGLLSVVKNSEGKAVCLFFRLLIKEFLLSNKSLI